MKKAKGFTLVELMIVIAVIAILATMGLLGFGRAQKAGRDTARGQIMKGVQVGLECVYGEEGAYPAGTAWDWSDLATSLTTTGGSACWGTVEIADPWKSMALTGPNPGTVSGLTGVSYTYACATPYTSYTLTLAGESGRIYTFESPK